MPDPAVAATTADPNADPNADLDLNDAPPAEGDDTAAEGDPNPEPDQNQPAPRATATSEAPPEPDGKPPTKEEEDALILQSMADILEISGETPPPAAPEDKPSDGTPEDKPESDGEPAKAGTTNPPTPATPPATPPKKRVTFELPTELEEPETLPAAPPVTPPPKKPAPPTAPTAPDADAEYVQGLPEEAQEEVIFAQLAERTMAAKYPVQGKKMVTWYRQLDDLLKSLRAARPERSFGSDDEEYQSAYGALLKSKPVISKPDVRSIERQVIRSEVKEEVVAEMAPRLEAQETQTRALTLKPRVEAAAREFGEGIRKALSEAATSEPVKAVLKEIETLGDKAKEEYALELDIIADRTAAAQSLMTEYIMVRRGGVKVNPDRLSAEQEELDRFLVSQGDAFLKTGGKRLVNAQGQRFVPMQHFNSLARQVRSGQLDAEELQKVWTFTDTIVVNLLAAKAQAEIETQIQYEMERNKKYGLTRQKKPAETPKPPTVEPPKPQAAAPKTRPRPSIGPGTKAKANVPGEADIHSIYADQGFEP